MKIRKLISINTGYTRSINVERDNDSRAVIEAYIPTSRAISTLDRIVATITSGAVPRAWALVGPYGSGKSAFSLFLSHLLGGNQDSLSHVAMAKLSANNEAFAAQVQAKIGGKGYLHILVSGSPEPLTRKLLSTLLGALDRAQGLSRNKCLLQSEQIHALLAQEFIAGSDVLKIIEEVQELLCNAGYGGVLLVIDELGKFLEYEARNPKANDIHLLQMLAEHSSKATQAPLQLVVLMHQAFELYARNVRETLKNEWQKVQGRFETISFIEAAEQSMRILASVISHNLPAAFHERIKADALAMASELQAQGALPGSLACGEAADLFAKCYPLHPLTQLTLPVLCQKVAQNERTLFSYLGSAEPHGFADSLNKLDTSGEEIPWIQPWEIYDYFIQNQPASIADANTQRRWVEVASAVDRLGGGFLAEEELLKTIGLLNIIGAQGGLKPSAGILSLLSLSLRESSKKPTTTAIAEVLGQKSLVTYRKFNNEYRVWQGSDFDFDEALRAALAENSRVDLIEKLNQHSKAAPIVARRYTIETGTLRYFMPVFANLANLPKLPSTQQAELVYLLAGQAADRQEVRAKVEAQSANNPHRVFAIVSITEDLLSSIAEVDALRQIQERNPLLASDPIAQRELNERIRQARTLEESLLSGLLDDPSQLEWHWRGKPFFISTRRALQEKLSKLLEEDLYPAAPHIHNELINRDKPSATANSAKKKLLVAMLDHADEADLGFEKFPAEKAMYLALLRAPGIHRFDEATGRWGFYDPDPQHEAAYKMASAWQHIQGFFVRAEKHPLPVSELFAELAASPFGVKEGVLPILFLAAYLVHEHDIAVFDQGIFSGSFTLEMLEKLLKNPGNISVQNASLSGMRLEVFKKYTEVLLQGRDVGQTFLPIAKQLSKLMGGLPEYTLKTKRISEEAQAVRTLFLKADSPGALLFQVLPKACGFDPDTLDTAEKAEAFVLKLHEVLKELNRAYFNVLGEVASRLRSAFAYGANLSLAELRDALRGRASGLENYTVDTDGLKAFILRLEELHGDDGIWLERIASLLTKKPATKWGDADLQVAELRLVDLVRSFNNLEQLRIAYGERTLADESDFDVMLIHTMRPQQPEHKEFVRISKARMASMSSHKSQIQDLLKNIDGKDRRALLASLLEEELAYDGGITKQTKEGTHD
jgi:hypothetical protein